MLHLRTFGGLSVAVDDQPAGGAAHQRKTLALLALVAAAGRRGIGRDKIMAYLWPDADTERARGLLKQACYALRRDLRAHDLFLGTAELRLNPAVITSDIQAFEAALERGDPAHAVSIYTGSFLDGFYLSDSAEFEHWVETERGRLRHRACQALHTLATEAAARGDYRGAADWGRNLIVLEPLNSRVAVDLMKALAAAGDLAGALEVARTHEERLREELDAAPDPAVEELAERLREGSERQRQVPQGSEHEVRPREPRAIQHDTPQAARLRVASVGGKLVIGAVLVGLAAATMVLRQLGRSEFPAGTRTVNFNVLGPDGRSSICNYLPAAAVVTARLLNATPPPRQGGYGAFACPESQLRLSVPASGSWHVRIDLPPNPRIDELPLSILAAADVSHDVVIREGSPLGGRGTFAGRPAEGIAMVVGWESLDGAMASGNGSGLDGRWRDRHGRRTVLQKGLRYTVNAACQYLGARLVSSPPRAGFVFPTEGSSIDCTMVPAPSVRFTHHLTRLVVTSMPGDIGGLSDDFARDWGYGWGVQYPVAPHEAPAHQPSASHLYQGGLLIGRTPDTVLSGSTLRGMATCGRRCRNLGLDARLRLATERESGKEVIWEYSDSGVPERAGLRVVQQSRDGRPPADYVLFRFIITNVGRQTTTFHAGFHGDWDIGADEGDDIGRTDMGGRLMYQTDNGDRGPYLGTLLLGDAPVTGNFVYRAVTTPTLGEQVDALAGRLSRPESDVVGDTRYIHGAGPFTLAPSQRAELWMAIVAGDSRHGLLASASAAAADIASQRQGSAPALTQVSPTGRASVE